MFNILKKYIYSSLHNNLTLFHSVVTIEIVNTI